MNKLKCPNCLASFLERMILEDPPKFEGFCSKHCGFIMYYDQREHPEVRVSQDELEKK